MISFETPFPSLNIDRKEKSAGKPKRASGRRKGSFLITLLKACVYSFAVFSLLFFMFLFSLFSSFSMPSTFASIPNKTVLKIDLNKNYTELRSDDILFSFMGDKSISFYDLINSINEAAKDRRVLAIVANVSDTDMGLAQMSELRRAIMNFRAKGKKAYVYSPGFGQFGNGTGEYYIATAFDEIWLQPHSSVGITGISMEVPFLQGFLKKIGVKPEFYRKHEYKNAFAFLTDEGFTFEHLQQTKELGKTIFDEVVKEAGKARNIKREKLLSLIDKAPLLSEEALAEGLVDKLAYQQDFMTEAKLEYKDSEFMEIELYSAALENGGGSPHIAYMAIEGMIVAGESTYNPIQGDMLAGSATIIEQLEDIEKNKDVKALVIRVNSPGGSYNAADEILHAIERLKKVKKIPVVVSIGDYGASGGYFIALAGDKVLVDSLSLTGSIGVLGGKIVLADLWNKIGVKWEEVNFGENAGILTSNRSFNQKERAAFNKSLDDVYKDFLAKTSKSRGIAVKDLDKLARGRVWVGRKAVMARLVDGPGGIHEAIIWARVGAGDKEGKFGTVYYPRAKSFSEKLSEMMNGTGSNISEFAAKIGLDMEEISVLQRLQYDAVMAPIKIGK